MNGLMRQRFITFVPRPDADERLYCFPFAGGSAAAYRRWAAMIPQRIELAACQPPGRLDRFDERMPATVTRLVDMLTKDFLNEADGRPFRFFGHSFGALVAFLVTQRLQELGAPLPQWLGLSGRSAPQATQVAGLHLLDDETLVTTLSRLGGIPPEIITNPELMSLVLPPLRQDLMLSDDRQFTLSGPVHVPRVGVFGATDDALMDPATLDRWGEVIDGNLSIRLFDGGHFFLWRHEDDILREASMQPRDGSSRRSTQ